MIAREWLQLARERLSGFPSAEVDARLLLEYLIGRPLDLSRSIDVDAANTLLERRVNHEPVQYITGEAPFRYLVLQVGPGVLIPRPETELLVDLAKSEIGNRPLRVVDIGSGSGAVAISIATETSALVTAVEIDSDAFVWLKRNVDQFAPELECVCADVADVRLHDIDLVVANPPYVPDARTLDKEVADFEPHVAIFGGEDGTSVPEAFMRAAFSMLRSGGMIIMEHSENHQDRIVELAEQFFVDVKRHQDLLDRPRFISARMK